jgi:hypothetical protein
VVQTATFLNWEPVTKGRLLAFASLALTAPTGTCALKSGAHCVRAPGSLIGAFFSLSISFHYNYRAKLKVLTHFCWMNENINKAWNGQLCSPLGMDL